MFGYTVPSYGRLSPSDNRTYRRYYCEGCHQLRAGYGLTGTATVNYDMTFNTILLNGLKAECPDFGPTERRLCVLDAPKADSELMRRMAAYTLILTKWELYDDETDLPSPKSKVISFVLNNAIEKAVAEHPGYDEMVGAAFAGLRDMELDGCRDALAMGRAFGRGLAGPLREIAGDVHSDALEDVFVQLTACVYLMDAIDDLDDDYLDGTYNPLLPESGFVNARSHIDANIYEVTSLVGEAVGALQGSYSKLRPLMKGNLSLCDNVVYFGIPESAKKVITGTASAKASVKNVMANRSSRLSERAGGVEARAEVQGVRLLPADGAQAARPGRAAPAAPRAVPPAPRVRPHRPRLGHADPHAAGVGAQPAGAALAVALVHACPMHALVFGLLAVNGLYPQPVRTGMVVRVAYMGIPGSNSEQAATELAGAMGWGVFALIPAEDSAGTVRAMDDGEADYGVVASKNVHAGPVIETEDVLAARPDIEILRALWLPIHHCVFTKGPGVEVRVVASHIQALLQTRRHLDELYPGLERREVVDTAIAAEMLADGRLPPDCAVICRRNAGEACGLTLVHENIEDIEGNMTEFELLRRRA